MNCRSHPHAALICPVCIAARGGASRSPKKVAAVRRNIERVNRRRARLKAKAQQEVEEMLERRQIRRLARQMGREF